MVKKEKELFSNECRGERQRTKNERVEAPIKKGKKLAHRGSKKYWKGATKGGKVGNNLEGANMGAKLVGVGEKTTLTHEGGPDKIKNRVIKN